MSPERADNARHVGDEILDYLEGRLIPERAREIRAHLASCRQCAGDYAWAERTWSDLGRAGARHLRPDRVVALAEGGAVSLSSNEQSHLRSCSSCQLELTEARQLPAVDDIRVEAADDSGAPWEAVPARSGSRTGTSSGGFAFSPQDLARGPNRRRWFTAAAAICVVLALIWARQPQTPSIASLARIEPLPVHIHRGAPPVIDSEMAYRQGLDHYRLGDFAAAAERLARAAELDPRQAEIRLYLGSAEMLTGHYERAIGSLLMALKLAQMPGTLAESKWQLANAYLVTGNERDATAALREVAQLDQGRRQEALHLIATISERQ